MSNCNLCVFFATVFTLGIVIASNSSTPSMDYYEDQSLDYPEDWKKLNTSRSEYIDKIYNISAYKKYPASEEHPDTTIARQLEKSVRVLCWVLLEQNFIAPLIKASWGKRCTVLLFMSTAEDKSVPTVKLPIKDAKKYHWGFTKAAFRYVFEHHRNEADWFLRADDDTYIVMENLRYLLKDYNSDDPIYFGCRYKPYVKQGFMTSGAGYVLSKAALRKFVREGLPSPMCKQDDEGPSDIVMGLCMENIGVKAMDSRDPMKRGRFLPFLPRDHIFPFKDKRFWYWNHIYDPVDEGFNCCSDFAVSFHYVQPGLLIEYDYLIYKLKPFGIKYNYPPLN